MSGKKREKGENDSIEDFFGYKTAISQMLGRMVNKSDVEDLLQETFIRVYRASKERKIEHPKTYTFRTARNLALNFLDRKDFSITDSIEDFPASDVYPTQTTPADLAESGEEYHAFCRAVLQLPSRCRDAFILKRVLGMSVKEVAQFMDISPSTAEKHIAKGMVYCARHLKEHGFSLEGYTSRSDTTDGRKRKPNQS